MIKNSFYPASTWIIRTRGESGTDERNSCKIDFLLPNYNDPIFAAIMNWLAQIFSSLLHLGSQRGAVECFIANNMNTEMLCTIFTSILLAQSITFSLLIVLRKKRKSSMQIASWFHVIELVLHSRPAPTSSWFLRLFDNFLKLPANLLVIVMWRRQPSFSMHNRSRFSAASLSLLRSARSNRYHQSLSLLFDRKYVYCVRRTKTKVKRNEKS